MEPGKSIGSQARWTNPGESEVSSCPLRTCKTPEFAVSRWSAVSPNLMPAQGSTGGEILPPDASAYLDQLCENTLSYGTGVKFR